MRNKIVNVVLKNTVESLNKTSSVGWAGYIGDGMKLIYMGVLQEDHGKWN